MRHMRLYEDNTKTSAKDYFKNKIDWKLFNYMLYKLISYEDKGYSFRLSVNVRDNSLYKDKYYHKMVYHQQSGENVGEFSDFDTVSEKIEMYKENGLYYCIWVYHIPEKMRQEIYDMISDKLTLFQDDGVNVLFEPKK